MDALDADLAVGPRALRPPRGPPRERPARRARPGAPAHGGQRPGRGRRRRGRRRPARRRRRGAGHRPPVRRDPGGAGRGSGGRLRALAARGADGHVPRQRRLAAASVASARQHLAAVPDGLVGQVESVRDAMTARIDTYGPLLDTYVEVSARLPAILGWDGPRRYLVLTQDPAELRPTGGFIGSYGIIAFDRGRITERRFEDVAPGLPVGLPAHRAAAGARDYLLGPKQPWQFADANWSPDFPTSAQDALRLYTNESGDTDIDGVLGITTYTIDELLKVTGPITVPEYDVTIASGETTLKVLQHDAGRRPRARTARPSCPAFADQLLASLLALPPRKWGDLLGTADTFGRGHLLEAWFSDAADQELVVRSGFDGAVRQDPGDYLYPVDSNVAPASKLNLRHDADAGARRADRRRRQCPEHARRDLGQPGRGARVGTLPRDGQHGRADPRDVLPAPVPERSRVEAVSGGTLAPVTNPAVVEDEAGRTVIGTYLKVPPGQTSLRYAWTSPYARRRDQRDLPADDPGAARHAPGAAHPHDPGAGRLPDHRSQPGARRARGRRPRSTRRSTGTSSSACVRALIDADGSVMLAQRRSHSEAELTVSGRPLSGATPRRLRWPLSGPAGVAPAPLPATRAPRAAQPRAGAPSPAPR